MLEKKDYNYELPDSKIAYYALPNRCDSKLLIYKNGEINTQLFDTIPTYFTKGEILVVNETKVVPARLLFTNSTSATIEIFCLQIKQEKPGSALVECFVGNAKKWKEEALQLAYNEHTLQVEKTEPNSEKFTLLFTWTENTLSFYQILEKTGKIPLPPYIKREAESVDVTAYQSLFAKHKGSVAAPTASLHFTEGLLQQIKKQDVHLEKITLHVGAGTFQPMKAELVKEHTMHAEQISIPIHTLEMLIYAKKHKKAVTAVGTTVARTLESIYLLAHTITNELLENQEKGIDIYSGKMQKEYRKRLQNIDIQQLEYTHIQEYTDPETALRTLWELVQWTGIDTIKGSTSLMIIPGYTFQIVDKLITNFHQPESTLLLLVSAFVGQKWREIYDYALAHDFRFLSYGDACLLYKEEK